MARPLSLQAREKILAAASEALLEVGVTGFTVDDVSKRSGVAKTTIYRHFDSSSQLIVTALDSTIAPFPTPNTGSLRTDLRAYCDTTSKMTCNPQLRTMMLELMAAAAQNSELAKTKEAMFYERMTPVRTILELAQARGEISASLDLQQAVELAESPFIAHVMMHPMDPPDDAKMAIMIEFILAGLTGMAVDD